jgi:hypothetical protein
MKAKRKPATKAKRSPAPSDTHLISECVIYAREIAAFHAGFTAAPDGSSRNAQGLGHIMTVRSEH